MNAPNAPSSPRTFSNDEFTTAFEIAKKTLSYVGQFRTPPTPDVYEFWYRFCEGNDETLRQKIAFLVDDLGSVSREQIDEIFQQFLAADPSSDVDNIANELIARMSGLESLVKSGVEAGAEFGSSIRDVDKKLTGDLPTADVIKECLAEVRNSNSQMQSQLEQLNSELEKSQAQIREMRETMNESKRSMMTDPLTGVGNRRFFDSILKQSLTHADRNTKHIFLMLIDLDKFKEINDEFGHAAGDAVITHAATKIQEVAKHASVARFGGDEFAVFARTDSAKEGKQLADGISDELFKPQLKLANTQQSIGRISASIGVALLRPDDDAESWFQRADRLLYQAKDGGRNKVMAERVLDERYSS